MSENCGIHQNIYVVEIIYNIFYKKVKMEHENILTFEQTDRLKGLLIILVVFGHIGEIFTEKMQYILYSFHVTAFFFLVFLFNNDVLTFKNIIKILKRYYIPYTIFFIIALFAFTLYLHNEFDPMSSIISWFIGSGPLLRDSIGFSTYWFFPALISILVFVMLYNSLSLIEKYIFLILMIIAHFLIPSVPGEILKYFPFGMYVAFYLFIIGLVIKYIFYQHAWRNIPDWLIVVIFFFALVAIIGTGFNLASPLLPNIILSPLDFILHDFVMILGFFTMILLSEKIGFFQQFGKYAIAIFTVHPFVIQIINLTYNWNTILEGLIKFLLVFVISYIIAKGIYLINLNIIIYPR